MTKEGDQKTAEFASKNCWKGNLRTKTTNLQDKTERNGVEGHLGTLAFGTLPCSRFRTQSITSRLERFDDLRGSTESGRVGREMAM